MSYFDTDLARKDYKDKFFITFDIDWAPDFAIDEIIDFCVNKKVKAKVYYFCFASSKKFFSFSPIPY